MLTRDRLSADEWASVRNTPHFVVLVLSNIDGSPFDEMLERHAGLRAISEALNSTHPLIREIAGSSQILEAQEAIRSWFYALADAERTPERIEEEALHCMSSALEAIADHGDDDDLLLYTDFVLATASRVARAAREGDVLGVGGTRVSPKEVEFIRRLEGIAASVHA